MTPVRMRATVTILATLLWTTAGFSQARAGEEFHLVTPEEHAREQAQGQPRDPSPPSHPEAPRIEIVEPSNLNNILTPARIEIRFLPQQNQTIDVNTLRVLYGWLEVDITDRIRKYCEVTPSGITADKAKLPPGSHRITVQIADTAGLVGRKEFFYRVVGNGAAPSTP
jgi:hypothetical protein